MSFALVIAAFGAGLAAAVAKGILGKEIQGRIERRITRSVEATIAALPDALQADYAEEWRAELAAAMAMPLTAAAFARGLRRSAAQLVGAVEPIPAAGQPVHRVRAWAHRYVAWLWSPGGRLAIGLVVTLSVGSGVVAVITGAIVGAIVIGGDTGIAVLSGLFVLVVTTWEVRAARLRRR